jgi:hypothetical protein
MVHMFGNVIEVPQKQKMAAPKINAIGGHVFFHKISLFFCSGISSWHARQVSRRSWQTPPDMMWTIVDD